MESRTPHLIIRNPHSVLFLNYVTFVESMDNHEAARGDTQKPKKQKNFLAEFAAFSTG